MHDRRVLNNDDHLCLPSRRHWMTGLINFSASWLLAVSMLFPALSFAQTAELKTAQTQIILEAGADTPRLVSLEVPGQPKWENKNSESLINSVEIADQEVPVHWQLNREASRTDSKSVAFIYESANPHLRLTWSWIAKESYGPIEHQIRIENLTDHELWIPMQDSFTFD